MKKMKKLASILLAMIMVLSMTVTAFAANITIEDSNSGSQYEGYKLFNATDNGDGNWYYYMEDEDPKTEVFDNKYRAIIIEAIKAVDKKVGNDIADIDDDKEKNKKIISTIGVYAKDSQEIRTFANAVYVMIKAQNLDADLKNEDIKNAPNGKVFENVDDGYWLIADVTKNNDSGEINSLAILNSAGKENINIKPKKDTVTVNKEVKENSDRNKDADADGWGKWADYNIGDMVPFRLIGKYDNNYKSYEKYKYVFHDTLSDGLDYVENSVTVKIGGKIIPITTENVKENGDKETKINYTVEQDGNNLTITFDDLKQVIPNDDTSGEVIVEYKAELNKAAEIAKPGNPNTVYLEYSNNPYDQGSTGNTPPVTVTVYTFELDVDKVGEKKDADGNPMPLNGAGFTLYKENKANEKDPWIEIETISAGTKEKPVTRFTFTGLDAGRYKLEESTAPDGYNPIEPIIFNVTPDYEDGKLTSLTVESEGKDDEKLSFATDINPVPENVENGTEKVSNILTTIKNLPGTQLPSTGGIGTTIFTAAGLILMAVAGALLILKKKNAKNN